MKSSLAIMLNSLNLPALSTGEIAALKSLQRDWNQHSARMNLLVPERALADQKTAFTAFLADPTRRTNSGSPCWPTSASRPNAMGCCTRHTRN